MSADTLAGRISSFSRGQITLCGLVSFLLIGGLFNGGLYNSIQQSSSSSSSSSSASPFGRSVAMLTLPKKETVIPSAKLYSSKGTSDGAAADERTKPDPKKDIMNSHLDNMVIVTAANYGYRPVLENWICQFVKLKMHKRYHDVVVLALDNDTEHFVAENYDGIVTPVAPPLVIHQDDDSKVERGGAVAYGSKDWNWVTYRKLSGVMELLKNGKDIFFIDLDIALVKDPVPHVMDAYAYPEGPDFVVQVDIGDPPPCAKFNNKAERMSAERSPKATLASLNSGLYFLRSNKKTIEWLGDAINRCITVGRGDDQVQFSKTGLDWEKHLKKLVFYSNCGDFKSKFDNTKSLQMKACMFHECEFPTGWGTGRWPGNHNDPAVENGFKWMLDPEESPYLYHPNFISGMKNKINKLKIKGLWSDDGMKCVADHYN